MAQEAERLNRSFRLQEQYCKDRSALQVRLRALSVPSDRNRSPRERPRGWYLGGSGSGEVVEALGRLEGINQDIRGRLGRSTSPYPRGPWTHHLHPGGRCGGGGDHGWGGSGSTCGVLSRFGTPRAKIGYPLMSLTIGCGRHISGPPGIRAEVVSLGVPQTGKIIEVKRRLSGSFFFDLRGLGGFVWGCMGRSDVSGALVVLTDMAKSDLKLFCALCHAK